MNERRPCVFSCWYYSGSLKRTTDRVWCENIPLAAHSALKYNFPNIVIAEKLSKTFLNLRRADTIAAEKIYSTSPPLRRGTETPFIWGWRYCSYTYDCRDSGSMLGDQEWRDHYGRAETRLNVLPLVRCICRKSAKMQSFEHQNIPRNGTPQRNSDALGAEIPCQSMWRCHYAAEFFQHLETSACRRWNTVTESAHHQQI